LPYNIINEDGSITVDPHPYEGKGGCKASLTAKELEKFYRKHLNEKFKVLEAVDW